jgi:NADP-dependent 3-hydroxy acid dehydrogenase YdfG
VELSDRVAVITGGASGIGLGLARALGRAGMRVANRVESELGPPFLVCNNAGVIFWDTLHRVEPEDWEQLFAVNVAGVMNGLRVFVPRLLASTEGGHVLNTASIGGLLPFPGMGAYIPAKYCVVGISEVLEQELADTKVGVSVLCPGVVATAIGEHTLAWTRARGRGEQAVARAERSRRSIAETGIDPDRVGEWVRAALESGEFWIFTHPEAKALVEARFARIARGFDAAARRVADTER